MKIKTLIITATLVVASVASSMAQVYSANAVGYVNLSLNPGLSIIANPLDNGANNLDQVLVLPEDAAGASIYRFKADTQSYGNTLQWAGAATGWYDGAAVPDPALKIVPPGEAFFLELFVPVNVTFVGDVPQGALDNPMPGGFNLSMKSSQVPQEAGIGHIADQTGPKSGLEFPAADGDTLFIWIAGTQKYDDPWQYANGVGWVQVPPSGIPNILPDGPVIPVATGFFVQKTGTGTQNWTRQFNVN